MKNTEYKPIRFTDRELLEIFPEAVTEIIPSKIKDWEDRRDKSQKEIREMLRQVPLKDRWFYDIYLSVFYLPEIYECERSILRLKRLLIPLNKNKSPLMNFQTKLENAKAYPIYELARNKLDLKPGGEKFVGLCPYHDERTPSFYLYPETNNFHCFGCGKHGDVIHLAEQLSGLTFKEAVESLQH